MRIRSILWGCALALAAWSAQADQLSWRATSVQGPRLPTVNTRVGVAMFSTGEPATYERRIRAAGAPADGRLAVQVESVYRFADGATIVMRSRETINLTPQGSHGRDEWTGEGEIAEGTGRFAGIQGRFTFRAVMGLDGQADGLLGDSFLTGRAEYMLAGPRQ